MDAALGRLEEHAGLEAVQAGSGQTFAEVGAERACESDSDLAASAQHAHPEPEEILP